MIRGLIFLFCLAAPNTVLVADNGGCPIERINVKLVASHSVHIYCLNAQGQVSKEIDILIPQKDTGRYPGKYSSEGLPKDDWAKYGKTLLDQLPPGKTRDIHQMPVIAFDDIAQRNAQKTNKLWRLRSVGQDSLIPLRHHSHFESGTQKITKDDEIYCFLYLKPIRKSVMYPSSITNWFELLEVKKGELLNRMHKLFPYFSRITVIDQQGRAIYSKEYDPIYTGYW